MVLKLANQIKNQSDLDYSEWICRLIKRGKKPGIYISDPNAAMDQITPRLLALMTERFKYLFKETPTDIVSNEDLSQEFMGLNHILVRELQLYADNNIDSWTYTNGHYDANIVIYLNTKSGNVLLGTY